MEEIAQSGQAKALGASNVAFDQVEELGEMDAESGWDAQAWLAAEHIAPMPTHPGARGFIDEHLASQGLARNVVARCTHFGLIPAMVAGSLLVLTTGRQYAQRFTGVLPVKVLPCPVDFPRMVYYQLWHERTHAASACRWLREQIKAVAAALRPPESDGAAA